MPNNQKVTPDFGTLAGGLLALGSVVGGLLWEGGSIRDIAQLTAALIVVGGTFGAVLISTPLGTVGGALRRIKGIFFPRANEAAGLMDQLLTLSARARKTGLASLESEAAELEDPFFQKAVNLVADSTSVSDMRSMMEIDIIHEENRLEAEAKVFETAGGYAPTVGIIGAVLGLIQVMKHLENIDEVGRGIAVSFVATVYGVALANLVLLPAAAKLKAHAAAQIASRDLILDGVTAIAEGLNPTLLRLKLNSYLGTASSEQVATQRLRPQVGAQPFTA